MELSIPHAKKHLSMPSLLKLVRGVFEEVPDVVTRKTAYSLPDCLMSALAMFSLKYPSLLQFDQDSRQENHISDNLKSLYGVQEVTSDTNVRERLDPIDPFYLQESINKIIAQMQRGKQLERFRLENDHYYVALDGTGYFSSPTIHCESCCEKKHRNGTTTYYHQILAAVMVHPAYAQVLPLAIEPIVRQDGRKKNDCEHNAAKRLLQKLRAMHPHLKMIVLLDGLYADSTIIRLLKELDIRYIITAKEDDLKYLHEFYRESKKETISTRVNGFHSQYAFVNKLPLNSANPDILVNVLTCSEQKEEESMAAYHVEFSSTEAMELNLYKQNTYLIHKTLKSAQWKLSLINGLKGKDRIKSISLTRMKNIQDILPKKAADQLLSDEIGSITGLITSYHNDGRARRGKAQNDCHIAFSTEKPKNLKNFKPNTYLFVNKDSMRKAWNLYLINAQDVGRKVDLDLASMKGLEQLLLSKGEEEFSQQEKAKITKVIEAYHCEQQSFTWISDLSVTEKNVINLSTGGRTRWHIENETLNTLKNQDYQFERNYGHGKKNLSTVFAYLMFTAFLIDQVQEFCCKVFQGSLARCGSRTALWARMRTFFFAYAIKSWEFMHQAITYGIQKPDLSLFLKPVSNNST